MLKALVIMALSVPAFILTTAFATAQDVQIDCADEPTDMNIVAGDIVNCSITPVADTDIFRFSGTSGHWVMLTLTDRTGSTPLPTAEIIDPNATPMDTLSRQDSGDRVIMELPLTGTYTVLVREAGDNHTVSYNLALQSIYPPAPEASTLCFDCELTQGIDVVGDSDLVLFEGEAGTTIIVTLTDRTGGTPRTVADIYDPNRDIVATLEPLDTGEAWQVELTATGTYTIFLSEAGDNHTASYSLALQQLFPHLVTAACLDYGEVVTESISPVADSEVYLFGGEPDTEIILTLADQTGGTPRPVAEVYDPDGLLAVTLSPQDGSEPWQTTLTKRGLYTVVVREGGFNHTVSYNLGLQCLFGDCPSCSEVTVEEESWGGVKSLYR